MKVFGQVEKLPEDLTQDSPMLHFFALDAALDIALDLVNIFVHLLVLFIWLNQDEEHSDNFDGISLMEAACRLVGFMVMVFLPIGLIGYHCMYGQSTKVAKPTDDQGVGSGALDAKEFDGKVAGARVKPSAPPLLDGDNVPAGTPAGAHQQH